MTLLPRCFLSFHLHPRPTRPLKPGLSGRCRLQYWSLLIFSRLTCNHWSLIGLIEVWITPLPPDPNPLFPIRSPFSPSLPGHLLRYPQVPPGFLYTSIIDSMISIFEPISYFRSRSLAYIIGNLRWYISIDISHQHLINDLEMMRYVLQRSWVPSEMRACQIYM